MADPPRYPDSDEGGGPDRGSVTSRPRWLSVLGMIVGIVLILLFVVLHLTGTIGPSAH